MIQHYTHSVHTKRYARFGIEICEEEQTAHKNGPIPILLSVRSRSTTELFQREVNGTRERKKQNEFGQIDIYIRLL